MRVCLAACLAILTVLPALAQEAVIPERRAVVSRDVDFYGGDLTNIFDTTFEACNKACLANPECRAFTFNSRAGACFPKKSISDRQSYDGAISAEIFDTPPATLTLGATRASDLPFLSSHDWSETRSQAETIGRIHAGGPWTVEALLDAAQQRRADGDTLNAMRWTGAAVAKTDKSDLWLEYARLNRDAAPTQNNKALYLRRALYGSMNAYLRAPTDPARVSALMVMAEMFEATGKGRQSLNALRLAETIQPREDVLSALDKAIAKYGFRISNHDVESDLAEPRICAEFNEPLVKAGVDYATYLRLPDQRLAVEAETRRICVTGVSHGERYSLTFRKGLPAASGETLARDTELTLYVRDRAAALRFPGRAYVLPRTADAGLPIETVNLDKVALRLQRVSDRNILRTLQNDYFGQPLRYWQMDSFSTDIAEDVWSGEGSVENVLNMDMTTRLPLGEIIADQPTGLYALTADIPGADRYDETATTQWFILSDIGVTTLSGTDGLHVMLRALSDASALADAKLTLLSRSNRILATAMSDAKGYARFEPGLIRGTAGQSPAMILMQKGDDFSFLSLTDPGFDLSDRGVEGNPPAPPVDVFLATDRGAYRAGETIHVTALARDGMAKALPDLPLTATLTRPDGVEYARRLSSTEAAGGHVFAFSLGDTVPRGTWKIAILSDPDAAPLATEKLLVEDFLPERIDFDLALPDAPLSLTDPVRIPLTARYLFGAPGTDLRVEGQTTLRARTDVDGYDGYRFGRHDERFNARTEYFAADPTDANGVTMIALPIPKTEQAGRPLELLITTRVSEGSGRPVERRATAPLAVTTPLIGIKPLFEEDVVREGGEAAFRIAAVHPSGQTAPIEARWTLNRVRTTYQWYHRYGSWEWEPLTRRNRVAGGDVTLGTDPIDLSAPVEWGQYELVVETTSGDYVASSTDFYAGWYAPADTTKTPDTLDLSLDKPMYKAGETAMLRVVPRFSGTALVSVMSNRLISMQAVDVTQGENLIPVPVTEDWGTGAYVSASVVRPADAEAGQNPARALGLAHALIDPGAKRLAVSIDAPEISAPRGPLDVAVKVDGIAEGETAYVTLAAVDLGILNMTGFASPDPSDHYFGQRRLGMEIRDIYGRLIDGLSGEMGALRSGGDATGGASFQSPPPTEELVAYFEGPVSVDAEGNATISFDMPEFNGTVRLMAIAWTPSAVGQADSDVIVRDPVVVTASLPRFLAPGDSSRLLLEMTHVEGPSGRMGLDVSGAGVTLAGSVPSGFALDKGATERLSIPIMATEVGDHALRIALTTPDGRQLVKTLTLPVRDNDPEISTTQRLTLAAGDTFSLDDNLFANLRAGTGSAIVSAGPIARFDAPGLLRALDRYPYGCTEQITSKAMPLLYFNAVSSALGMGDDARMQKRIDEAISVILTRQSSNGAFGLWRAGSGDFWLDAYVSDFLSRARGKGYSVPDRAFRTALDNLRNRVNYAADFDKGGEDVAYALMVLAREGAANMGDLRYYADVKAEALATPLAAAQIGAALAFYGDQTRADRMFAQAARMMTGRMQDAASSLWRADYGTNLRDTAGLLTLAVEAGSERIDRDALSARIGSAQRALSTQESVWSLMAAHALIADESSQSLTVNGTPQDGPFIRSYESALALEPLSIRNTGARDTYLTVTTLGVPNYPLQAGGYGYRIERSYFTPDGKETTLSNARSGDRLVVVLTVTPFEKGGARLMINDPLPAGFEIDNPNLLASGDIRELAWLKTAETQNAEFRSDRFLAAVDWRSDKSFRLAYMLRAVSPGAFHHPAASVEDMYRPQYRANTASGVVTVRE